MVLVKQSYEDNPIAIIFIMVAWPEEAYEIDFYKKCSKRRTCVISAARAVDRELKGEDIAGNPGFF